jgi:hypothetical protein
MGCQKIACRALNLPKIGWQKTTFSIRATGLIKHFVMGVNARNTSGEGYA